MTVQAVALAWFALAPFLLALRQTGPRGAAGLGFLFGWLFTAGAFSWLPRLAVMTSWRVVIMYTGIAVYFLVFGLLYNLMSWVAGRWLLVGAPALWVAIEYARSNLFFLALPWNLLGQSQYHFLPVIQIADITGLYGVSFLIVMVNQVLSQIPDLVAQRVPWRTGGRARRPVFAGQLLAVTAALLLVLAYGWHRLVAPEPAERLRVALVQANVLAREEMAFRERMAHLRAYEQLTLEAAKDRPELIIWPSFSLPEPISLPLPRLFVRRLARETGAHILVGGAGGQKLGPRIEGPPTYSNSEFLVSPSGRIEGQYNKVRLTPFDEYVPLQGRIRWPRWISALEEGFQPGTEYTVLQVAGARFGAPICWENSFPDVVRRFVAGGANFVASVTNEGFFGPTAAPYQTLAMNVFRAVENRVAIVRAATTGVSGFISPTGRVERLVDDKGQDLFVAGFLVRDVPLSRTKTFYTLHGDVFAQTSIAAAALLLIVAPLTRRRAATE